MENHIELYQASPSDIQSANVLPQTSTPMPLGNLTNLKLKTFAFSDEGKARSRLYLKKIVNDIKAF